MAAQALAVNGARVYIVGRTESKLRAAANAHGKNIKGELIPLVGDVANKEDIEYVQVLPYRHRLPRHKASSLAEFKQKKNSRLTQSPSQSSISGSSGQRGRSTYPDQQCRHLQRVSAT